MTRSFTLAVLSVRLSVWCGRACVAVVVVEAAAASMLPELEVDGMRSLLVWLLLALEGDDVCRARLCVDVEVDAPPSRSKGSSPAGGRRI